jgi:hypothetical protein
MEEDQKDTKDLKGVSDKWCISDTWFDQNGGGSCLPLQNKLKNFHLLRRAAGFNGLQIMPATAV